MAIASRPKPSIPGLKSPARRIIQATLRRTRAASFRKYLQDLLLELCRIDTTPSANVAQMRAAEARCFEVDTHLHTSYSTDSGMVGCTLGPEDAYRFALGATVTSSTGVAARLSRPLDFLVISDHAEYLGLAPAIAVSDPELLKNPWGKMIHDLARSGLDGSREAFDKWIYQMTIRRENPLEEAVGLQRTYWHKLVEAANKYNQPGRFTAFIGFEWTSGPNGNNLHRNVVFRDGGDKAKQIIPISQYESFDPEVLWQWMADYEQKTGGRLLAIPHNGNLSCVNELRSGGSL